MNRSPLKRSQKSLKRTPLARGTKPIPKRRKTPRRVSVDRAPQYLAWLRERPCIACIAMARKGEDPGIGWVRRVVVGAHTVNNGRSSKGPDSRAVPLCLIHHDELDGRLNTKITTKAAFAEKYGLDLEQESERHYAEYLSQKEKRPTFRQHQTEDSDA